MSLIYKLYDDEDCYVGSTTSTLKERLRLHIYCKDCKSVVILDRKKFTMELIEEVETKDRFKREQYWIDSLSTLSQRVCYFESEEAKIKYQTENNKERNKIYYETNLEHLKKYKEDNREHILETKKKYRENNKEKIAKYREDNKEHLNEKFNCECGVYYSYQNKSRHLKSKKHLAYICEKEKTNITLEKNEMIILLQ